MWSPHPESERPQLASRPNRRLLAALLLAAFFFAGWLRRRVLPRQRSGVDARERHTLRRTPQDPCSRRHCLVPIKEHTMGPDQMQQ